MRSVYDSTHSDSAYPEIGSKPPLRHALAKTCANSKNLSLCKFGTTMFFALQITASTFGVAISDIVGVCTKPEMIGIHATAIVAAVKNTQRGRPYTSSQEIRDYVRSPDSSVNRELSVAVLVKVAKVGPALARFTRGYFGPKATAILECDRWSSRIGGSHIGLLLGRNGQSRRSVTSTVPARSLYACNQRSGT